MNLIKKFFNSSDDILLSYFLFICLLNQTIFFSGQLKQVYFLCLGLYFIILIYFFFKKKTKNRILFYLPILTVILLISLDYLVNSYYFDLKIIFYLTLITFISFNINKIDNKSYIYGVITLSIIFISIGIYGWSIGGEHSNILDGAWGKNFIYFAYHYFPSTRNEDALIFIYAYPLSLVFLFFFKWNWKNFFFNQIILTSIILTFSRGAYAITLINIVIILFFIIKFKSQKISNYFIYLFFSLIITTTVLFFVNKTVKIDLFNVLKTKINSIIYFNSNDTHLYKVDNENIVHLYDSSKNSLNIKIDEWKKINNLIHLDNTKYTNFFFKTKKYYESSILYLIYNFNPLILFLLFYFFLKQFIYKIKYHKDLNDLVIYTVIIVNFFCLNLIYNSLDDIWNYLIGLYLISFVIKPSGDKVN